MGTGHLLSLGTKIYIVFTGNGNTRFIFPGTGNGHLFSLGTGIGIPLLPLLGILVVNTVTVLFDILVYNNRPRVSNAISLGM